LAQDKLAQAGLRRAAGGFKLRPRRAPFWHDGARRRWRNDERKQRGKPV